MPRDEKKLPKWGLNHAITASRLNAMQDLSLANAERIMRGSRGAIKREWDSPFRVSIYNNAGTIETDKVVIGARRAESDYLGADRIDIVTSSGVTSIDKSSAQEGPLTVAGDSFVYYDIDIGASTATPAIETFASWPPTISGDTIVVVAIVTMASGAVKEIFQLLSWNPLVASRYSPSGTSDDINDDFCDEIDYSTSDELTIGFSNLQLDFTSGICDTAAINAATDTLITMDGIDIGQLGANIYHKQPDVANEDATLRCQVLSDTLTDPGGTDTARINAIYAALETQKFTFTGHCCELDGSGPSTPTGSQHYKYQRCDDASQVIYRSADEGAVIDINDGYCWERVSTTPVYGNFMDNTDTVVTVFATCAACASGKPNEQWKKCSDDSNLVVYGPADSNSPSYDYAWVYDGSNYIKAYFSNMTSAAVGSNPCSIDAVFNVPNACSDLVIDYFSDNFNDNSLDTCKWTDNSSGGSISETNNRMECSAPSGSNYGRASNRVTDVSYTGNFELTVTITPVSFPAPSSGDVVGEVYVRAGGVTAGVEIDRSSGYYGVFYYNGSGYVIHKSYSAPVDVRIVRSGSTIVTFIDDVQVDSRGGSIGAITILNLNGTTAGSDVACTVAYDDLVISESLSFYNIRKCSDDSLAFSLLNQPTDTHFYACVSSAWTKVYWDATQGSTLPSTPNIIYQWNSPAQCADLTGWPISDSFSGSGSDSASVDDDNWTGRYQSKSGSPSISGGSLSLSMGPSETIEGIITRDTVFESGAIWECDFSSLSLESETTRTRNLTVRIDNGSTRFVQIYISKGSGGNSQDLRANSDTEGVNVIESNSSTSGTLKIERNGNDFKVYLDGTLKDTVTNSNLATDCDNGNVRLSVKLEASGTSSSTSTVLIDATRAKDSSAADIVVDPAGDSC